MSRDDSIGGSKSNKKREFSMKITLSPRPNTAIWALTLFEGEKLNRHPFWRSLNTSAKNVLTSMQRRKQYTGQFGKVKFIPLSGTKPEGVLVVGLGKKSAYHRRRMLHSMQLMVKTVREQKAKSLSYAPMAMQIGDWEVGQHVEMQLVAGIMASYAFTKFKTRPKNGFGRVVELQCVLEKSYGAAARKALRHAKVIGESVNNARDLANTPGGIMTPKSFVASARELVKGLPITITAFGEKEMREKRMGGILGVAKGSREEAQFLILEYSPEKDGRPIVFVGKGITFDSGGLNLKPENGMNDMHHDMAGGGAVVASIAAIAKLKVRRNVVGIVPLAENMPGGAGYRPGDVLKSMSGKTIEVVNTDAEGRVVLADALTYAKQYKPQLVIDVATLTGAAVVALGKRLIAALSNNEALVFAVREFSDRSGDYAWPLPLWEEFHEEIAGTFGDVANIGKVRGSGGVITAAIFLKEFAQGYEWLHLDIASTMVAMEGQPLAPGATGSGVRFLVDVARRFDELEPYLKS